MIQTGQLINKNNLNAAFMSLTQGQVVSGQKKFDSDSYMTKLIVSKDATFAESAFTQYWHTGLGSSRIESPTYVDIKPASTATGFVVRGASTDNYLSVKTTTTESTLAYNNFTNGLKLYSNGDGIFYRYLGVGNITPISTMHVYENNATTDATTGLTIEQAGTGDAILQFLITGTTRFALGLDNSDADKFKIGRGASWATGTDLIIDSSGNIGIGQTAPSFKLDVSGGIRIWSNSDFVLQSTTTDPGDIIFKANDGTEYARIYSAADTLQLSAGATSAEITIKGSTGNVGINAISPSEKLHVGGDVQIDGGGGTIGSATLANGWLKLGTTLAIDDNEIFFGTTGYIGTIGAYNLNFRTNGANDRLVIDSSGNVGIGTASPGKTLDVAGSSRLTQNGDTLLLKANTDATGNKHYAVFYGTDTNVEGRIGSFNGGTGSYDGGLIFETANHNTTAATTTTERMRITHDGKVGINTNGPGANLHVNGTTRSDFYEVTATNGNGIRFWQADDYKIYMSATSDATWGGKLDGTSDYNMYFRMNGGTNRGFVFRNGATNVAQIDAGGNYFGIGDISITKNNPWLTLDSPSTGADGVEQSAGISIGESGYKGSAALHLTYTGDGYGHIGMGTVSAATNLPAYEAMRFHYTDNTVSFYGAVSMGSTLSTTGDISSSGAITVSTDLNVGASGGTFKVSAGGDLNYKSGLLFGDYSTGRIGVGTTSPSTTLHVVGDTTTEGTQNSVLSNMNLYRDLATYDYASGNVTGAIKITLPISWTNTMLSIVLRGYNYNSDSHWSLQVGGYNYSTGPTWQNTGANLIGEAPFNSVKFGHDGTKCCIILGTTSTVWAYPKIVIEKVLAGFQNYNINLNSGWSISIITSETGITYTGTSVADMGYLKKSGGTVNGNINIAGTNSLSFSDYGGGWNMSDTTWIRTTGNKSIYQNSGTMRTDGTLHVGNAGATLSVVSGGNFAFDTNVLYGDATNNRVGINTSSPGVALDVTGAIRANNTGLAATIGGAPAAAPSVGIATQTSYMQIVAGSGAATNSGGLIFHNPNISTAGFEYVNTDANTGYFNFKSDDTTWNVRINGNTVWHAGNDGTGSTLDADLLDGLQPATANTASTIVQRDSSGNFSAGTITATLSGNATTATSATKASNLVGAQWAIPYQSATDTTSMLSAGTAGQVLKSNGSAAPSWQTLDMTYMPDATFKKSVKVATTADLGASLQSTNTLTGYSTSQSLACTTTAASTTITTTSTAGLKAGAVVSTATVQLASGTAVATITNATTFTVTNRTNITTTAITGNGTTATATFAAQTYVPYAVGSTIVISGATPATYNGSKVVTACTTTTVQFASTETVTASVQGTIAFTIAAGTSITTAWAQTIAALSIDGITVALNDRILVKNQTTVGGVAVTSNRDNGIYYVSTLGTTSVPWVLTRVADGDTASKIASAMVAVDSGTTYGGYMFDNDFKTTDTLGTTAMSWNSIADNGKKLSYFAATTSAELAGVISDETGSGSLVFATSPTFTTPRLASGSYIADSNGNELIKFPTAVASAVNDITISNAATGGVPSIVASGGDTNISLNLAGKGTGVVTAATAAVNTNTTQLATTAFVVGQASSTTPLAIGTAAAGTSLKYAREDHVHSLGSSLTFGAPTAVAAITSANSGVINLSDVVVGTNGFATGFHMGTLVASGYRQHISIGGFRTGTSWNGGMFVGLGGADANPTEYFLMSLGGEFTHSSGKTFWHSGNFTPNQPGAYLGISNTSPSSGYGISLYGGASTVRPNYGFMFAGTATFGTHGAVTGDWATYFTMTEAAGRGWIFRDVVTGNNVFSISNTGNAVSDGSITASSITINKSGTDSVLNFAAASNDPGYIKHYENANTSVMSFSVSDDDIDTDYFAFGNTGGGPYNTRAKITANGWVTAPRYYVGWGTWGTCGMFEGNGDGGSYGGYNMIIKSHWGIGFRDLNDVCRMVIDTRAGSLSALGTIQAGGNGGVQAFQIGDDAGLWDFNQAHCSALRSTTDNNRGYLYFGTGNNYIGGAYGSALAIESSWAVDIKVNAAAGYWTLTPGLYSGGLGTEPGIGVHTGTAFRDGYGVIGWDGMSIYKGWARSWTNTSNKEVKENIQPYNIYDGYDVLKQLKFYSYTYKEKNPYDYKIGVFAQDAPYVVSDVGGKGHDDANETPNIDLYSYTSLVGVATQVLQEKVETLETIVAEQQYKIDAQQVEIDELRARLDRIERMINIL